MVLVTAACGNVMSRIIPILLQNGIQVKALDANPAVENLKEIGVAETCIGDVHDPDTYKKAMEGCTQVLYQPTLADEEEAQLAWSCIDVAVEMGIEQFVMLSVLHPGMSTLLQHTQKLKAEEYLIYKGLSDGLNYTILQPTHYYHNFPVPIVVEGNCYKVFYDPETKLSLVDAEDVGAVAARVLTEPGHQNATYELVGDEFLSSSEMVDLFNRYTGKNVSIIYETDPEETMKMFSITDWEGYSADMFRHLADTYTKYGLAGNSHVLTWLLGRAPRTFEDFVKREMDKIK
ncbi:MAG: NmrA family NAD(P)-binding protein [Lachnospiraceae bacterium]|nr:NmrA family NAD(P)-binding protein [Lachnospiraceae bacterium]